MKVSIIVPVYNTAQYLPQCLDSLCGQTYRNLEIILVNDGSTDHSGEIAAQYAARDPRIQVINQENMGVSKARNAGLAKADGVFVIFVDSDDWLDKQTCEIAVKYQQVTGAEVVLWPYTREYDGVSRPVSLFPPEKQVWDRTSIGRLFQRMVGLDGEQLRQPQQVDSLITVWCKLYAREAIGTASFVDTKIIGTNEDALFNIQVFSGVQKAAYVSEPFYHYRKTNVNSLTHKYKNELAVRWKELYKRIYQHLNQINAKPELYQALSNRICLGLIGLGLNLAEDTTMTEREKRHELKRLLQMPHYVDALKQLPLQYFSLHWRLFFFCAREQWTGLMYVLLVVMNRLRGI